MVEIVVLVFRGCVNEQMPLEPHGGCTFYEACAHSVTVKSLVFVFFIFRFQKKTFCHPS